MTSSIAILLVSFTVMCLGHNLLNTLVGLRAALAGWPDWAIGVMTAMYYMGFIVGASLSIRLIFRIGHAGAFAVCAVLAASVALALGLFFNPWAWMFSRFVYGICAAGIHVAVESWLGAAATNGTRGRVMAAYMIVTYAGAGGGQLLLLPAEPEAFTLFAVAALLLCLSPAPLAAGRTARPDAATRPEVFGPRALLRAAPLAVAGCFCTGLILGSFVGFTPAYLTQSGFDKNAVALIIGATMAGGFLFQWPIGALSDRFGRRETICLVGLTALCAVAGLFLEVSGSLTTRLLMLAVLFGGSNYGFYSLFVALINDVLEPRHRVAASGGLLGLYAAGAVLGPLVTAGFMGLYGPPGFLLLNALACAFITLFAVLQMARERRIPDSLIMYIKNYIKTES